MKRFAVILLTLVLLLGGCGANRETAPDPTGAFVDSTGRAVRIPPKIEKIAITGPLSQVYILPLAGDMLVGVSEAYTSEEAQYLPDYLTEKPVIGQLYGGTQPS